MFTIRKATVADCELIHKMAKEVFPATYKEILSPEQLDYMMDCVDVFVIDWTRIELGPPNGTAPIFTSVVSLRK